MGVKTFGRAAVLAATFSAPALGAECKPAIESETGVNVREMANQLATRSVEDWQIDFPEIMTFSDETLTKISEEISSERRIDNLTEATLSTLNKLFRDLESGRTIQWDGDNGVFNKVAFAVWDKLEVLKADPDLTSSDVANAFEDVKGDVTNYVEAAADRLIEIRDMPVCEVENTAPKAISAAPALSA